MSKLSLTQMLSGLFFFPPVLLEICSLGCLQLAHKPEIWHLNPFIKSWALKWAEDRSWSKENYSLDQDQWGFTPRIKPPELGVSQIQALILAFLRCHIAGSVIFHEVGEVSLKNQKRVSRSRAGYRGSSQNAHSVTFHLLRHKFMWSLNNYLFHTKPDISLKPTNTACRHIS